ncbi:MAG: hypothetical protein NWE88_02000 [Candidatus Bathyarchaeota archaeon]|nr:hypothetical protein [Candidatus Bathyarchaeota archaeon]
MIEMGLLERWRTAREREKKVNKVIDKVVNKELTTGQKLALATNRTGGFWIVMLFGLISFNYAFISPPNLISDLMFMGIGIAGMVAGILLMLREFNMVARLRHELLAQSKEGGS